MMQQLRVLLRVKKLKEEEQLRSVHRKRAEAADALRLTEEARARVAASASTLRRREDLIYDEIIGQVVGLAAIEGVKAKVVALEESHARLVDAQDRCAHVQRRLEEERDAQIVVHRRALRDVDKYVLLTDAARREAMEIAEAKEETEIEDLFCRRVREAP
jgi:hypothetical protein